MKEMKQDRIALDRVSVRTTDDLSGHLHVETANLSKAAINPYAGREIPDSENLGLDPNKTYRLLRHPDELAAAAKTIAGKPLLFSHKPVSTADHDHMNVVGAISEPRYEHPFLKGKLAFWTKDAINAIDSGNQRELSCGYHYKADFTPGTYEGKPYDAVMRDLSFNHCALVAEGRAGPECMVGDSMENLFMTTNKVTLSRTGLLAQGALAVFLKPKLAQDAKIDLPAILATLTAKNFAERKPTIAMDVKRKISGKLAKDEAVESDDVISALETILPMLADEPEPAAGDDDETDATDEDETSLVEKLKAMGYTVTKSEGASDEEKDDDEKKKLADEVKAKDAEMKDMVKKPAMDAAIARARTEAAADAIKTQNSIRDAERAVRPWVGDLTMSFDSAEGVYRAALKTVGCEKADTAHKDALLDILGTFQKPGEKPRHQHKPELGMDEASVAGFASRYPDAAHIRQL